MSGDVPILLFAVSTLGAVAIGVAIGLAAGFIVARRLPARAAERTSSDAGDVERSPEVLAEADAELDQRLSVLAHDIRSLLGPILGYADLIRESSGIEQARSHAAKILKAGDRVEKLADDVRSTTHDRHKAAARLRGSGGSVDARQRKGP